MKTFNRFLFESSSHFLNESSVEYAKNLLKKKEGFSNTPYWDVNALRAGYGSDTYTDKDGKVHKVTSSSRVSLEDAERDLERRTREFMSGARRDVGEKEWDRLHPRAQAALTSMAYNYGSIGKGGANVAGLARSGNLENLAKDIETRLAAHDKGINASRRKQEAELIRNTNYDQNPTNNLKPTPTLSTKGSLDSPSSTRVLAKLKGETGELDKSTGQFSKRDWSSTEGERYKTYGGK